MSHEGSIDGEIMALHVYGHVQLCVIEIVESNTDEVRKMEWGVTIMYSCWNGAETEHPARRVDRKIANANFILQYPYRNYSDAPQPRHRQCRKNEPACAASIVFCGGSA